VHIGWSRSEEGCDLFVFTMYTLYRVGAAHIHRVLCPEIGTCPTFGCVVWRVKQKIGFQNVTHTGPNHLRMSRIEKNSQTRTVLRPAALPLGPTFFCPTLPTFDHQSMSLQDFGIHNSRIPELSGSLNF
jgi:hypothetical protein